MDRIEAAAHIEAEQEKRLEPLKLPSLARFKVKKVSNQDHAKKTALAGEISQIWAIPVPRLMKAINEKGYTFILQTFNEVRKNPNARNPAALFLWTIKNCKVELKEVELK
jgi:hypothetical protein